MLSREEFREMLFSARPRPLSWLRVHTVHTHGVKMVAVRAPGCLTLIVALESVDKVLEA